MTKGVGKNKEGSPQSEKRTKPKRILRTRQIRLTRAGDLGDSSLEIKKRRR